MGLVVTPDAPAASIGNRKRVRGSLQADNAYAAGGEPITAQDVGLAQLEDLNFLGTSTNGYSVTYDNANGKVVFRRTDQVDDPEEGVPGGTDLSAEIVRFEAIGY